MLALPAIGTDTPGWSVRVVPNLYPAFERQEVVVHTPRARALDRRARPAAARARRRGLAAARRGRARGGLRRTSHALVNEGRAAGRQPAAHALAARLAATTDPPVAAGRAPRDLPDLRLLSGARRGTRVVEQRDGLVLLCPYAGRGFRTRCVVAPLEHEADGYEPALGAALDLAAEVVAPAAPSRARRGRSTSGCTSRPLAPRAAAAPDGLRRARARRRHLRQHAAARARRR